jgi:hypothetical protein
MKGSKMLTSVALTSGLLLGGLGLYPFQADAATPVYAGFVKKNETKIASVASIARQMNWGGGVTTTYSVTFTNGLGGTWTKSLNQTTYTEYVTYSLGASETQRTWKNTLRVANGTSDTDTGSVTLKRW